MGTRFSEIYDRAVFKFKDYSFLTSLPDLKDDVLQSYLLSAITDFQHSCTVDITKYDLDEEYFEETLDNEMIEILAVGVSYYWLHARILDTKLLRNLLHSDAYTSYSPANLLNQMSEACEKLHDEFQGRINTYSFRYCGIEKLKT